MHHRPTRHRRTSLLLLLLALVAMLSTAREPQPAHAATAPFAEPEPIGNSTATTSVAWGDVDGDGDLDLAVGISREASRLYCNVNGTLTLDTTWVPTVANTTSVAWGDVDGDGTLDLAIGNFVNPLTGNTQPSQLYRNISGTLTLDMTWTPAAAQTLSVAWGDVDGDGDLDLAVGNDNQPNQLYRNISGTLTLDQTWSPLGNHTSSVAWGDVDGDGDLDLAVGNNDGDFEAPTGNDTRPSQLYRNISGTLTLDQTWTPPAANTNSVAWGDVDGDSDLDLALGNGNQPSQLYRNISGTLTLDSTWVPDPASTTSIAWGDVDGDGDLDLAIGNYRLPSQLYRNSGGKLALDTTWNPASADSTRVAWGDVDGDGTLDLTIGNNSQPSQLYRNRSATLNLDANWNPARTATRSVAWGDVDGDGDLDLAVGNIGTSQLYRNTAGTLILDPAWNPSPVRTESLAWGDVDGDGDLDLALGNDKGNNNQSSQLYRNNGGTLTLDQIWKPLPASTLSIAWGDVDGDGDLDLAVGNNNQPNQLYRNTNGTLTVDETWMPLAVSTHSVAWGDVDNDGDLDLAIGNRPQSSQLYRNTNGILNLDKTWTPAPTDTTSLAWGDVDGDGNLDLMLGNSRQPSQLYHNNGGSLSSGPIWTSTLATTESVAWGDVDGDGDLDLGVGNYQDPSQLYRNSGGTLTLDSTWTPDTRTTFSVAWGDVDGDGDLDLARGNDGFSQLYRFGRASGATSSATPQVRLSYPMATPKLPSANDYAISQILSSQLIPFPYTLTQPLSQAANRIIGQFSLTGVGDWQPAIPISTTQTTNLASSPTGTAHIYTWDTFASGVFGQSDNVVFRLIVLPDLHSQPNQVPGPFLYGSTTAATLPFRLRGTQPQVLLNDQPVVGAQVYQLSTRKPIADANDRSSRTNQLGYLEGRGTVALGDHLVALQEITHTATYNFYYTNASPVPSGLDGFPVTQPGVQKLTVSPNNALMLLNLSVSLEWDARSDTDFMRHLRENVQQVSSTLYKWSGGQIALGKVTIYQAKDHWYDQLDAQGNLVQKGADVRIRASDRVRPNASQGGITMRSITETLHLDDGTTSTIIYEPGNVRLGAVWKRSGSPGLQEQGIDWVRALAHELGHYALYLDDNYLGLNDKKQLTAVTSCPGAMSNPYSVDPISFRPDADWLPGCQETLSNRTNGRSDWATIKHFYDNPAIGFKLRQPLNYTANDGPNVLPLEVTQFVEPPPPATATATSQIVQLTKAEGGDYIASDSGRAFLFSANGTHITDLGQPIDSQIIARGATADDELCVYDLPIKRLGCTSASTRVLTMGSRSDWQPDVVLTPVTSRTLQIAVAADGIGLPVPSTLKARLFPADTAQAPIDANLSLISGQYVGLFSPTAPVLEGLVRVWVGGDSAPRREVVTDYAVGGNPAPPRRPPRRSRRKAPAISSDGQVILFTDDIDFKDGEFFSLQTVTHLPADPPTARVIGPGYRFITSSQAPSLKGVDINMAFASEDIAIGSNGWIAIYYYPEGGTTWERRSDFANVADSTEVNGQVAGPGIYALMVSQPLELNKEGWNQIEWSGATMPITDALDPIIGSYSHLYGYDETDLSDPWKLYVPKAPYAPDVPDWVNEQSQLVRGDLYRIYVTAPLTAPVRPTTTVQLQRQPQAIGSLPLAPATYYAKLTATAHFTPEVGLPVVARVNNTICGQSSTRQLDDGSIVFAIDVFASGAGDTTNCGSDNIPVSFTIGDYQWPVTPMWENTQLHELTSPRDWMLYIPTVLNVPVSEPPLGGVSTVYQIYLPIVSSASDLEFPPDDRSGNKLSLSNSTIH